MGFLICLTGIALMIYCARAIFRDYKVSGDKKAFSGNPSSRTILLVLAIGFGFFLMVFGLYINNRMQPYVLAGGHIWVGVRLYYGDNHQYVGEVLGGNDKMIKVHMSGGSREWKNRDAVRTWYVRRDDPALDRQEWEVLNE